MDKDEVFQLLTIANLAKQWPNLSGIHDAAIAKLEDHAKTEAAALAKKREEDKKKVDADREMAKVEAEAKAKAEAKPKPEPVKPEPALSRPAFSQRPQFLSGEAKKEETKDV